MLTRILFSGSGGQGVLTMGNILGNAAMNSDLFVTYLPSYGAAMRGGTANCTVCISDEEIASPVVSAPDLVVAMNQPSIDTFAPRLEKGGKLLYNSSLAESADTGDGIEIFSIQAGEIAEKIANVRSANMVLLGAFIKISGLVDVDVIYKSIEQMLGSKTKLIEMSKKAVTEGYGTIVL